MLTENIIINAESGLHARPAGELVKRVSYQESVSLFGVPILLIMDEAERASFMTLLEARCTDAILVASGRVVRNPTNTEE